MKKAVLTTIFLLFTISVKSPITASQEIRDQEKRRLEWEVIQKQEMLKHRLWEEVLAQEQSKHRTSLQDEFDVLHYDINLIIEPDVKEIGGTVTVICSVLASSITSVSLDLYDNMTVGDISLNGESASFSHVDDVLTIPTNGPVPSGEIINIAISYSGSPDSVGRYGPFTFSTHGASSTPTIYSISTPVYARTWWPCKDVPDDKATADIGIAVPDPLVVASNGRLVDVVNLGNGKHRYEWRESYPISTYLISVAISDYVVCSEYYHYGPTDSMEVMYFIYPEDSAVAMEDFNVTVPMLEFYSGIFGPYPFIAEKYAMAEANWGSLAMEHQTCTTLGRSLLSGTHKHDRVIAHELAHQWWGDFVTIGDWRDIWLNEGFATYAEALWEEHTKGPAAYLDYMAGLDFEFGFPGSIYDPDDLFNITVYWKGAWALHMLRFVLGDTQFFQALNDYGSRHAYNNALTSDFQAVCESIYGQSLAWFFDQWIYGTGRPFYVYSWTPYASGGRHFITLEIKQKQQGAEIFRMPLTVFLSGAGWDSTVVVFSEHGRDFFTFEIPDPIETIALDPDGWVLKYTELGQSAAISPLFLTNYPNPFDLSSSTRVVVHLPSAGNVELAVFNVDGTRLKTLHTGHLGAGLKEFLWEGENDKGIPLSSGVYFIRMNTPHGNLTQKALLVK